MEFILDNELVQIGIIIFISLILGSFASMLCYRLPRDLPVFNIKKSQKKHLYSFCPICEHRLTFLDLFPLFSWFLNGGKCRHCKNRISIQYPIIEFLTLSLGVLPYFVFGFSVNTFILISMAPILVSLFIIDWNFKILPNVLNLILFIGGVTFQFIQQGQILPYFLATIIYPGSMVFIRWAFLKITGKDGLGFGDIKFFGAAGIWLGLEVFSAFLLLSSLFGIVFGGVHKLLTKEDLFPFGPALIVAFLVVLYTKDIILTVL